MARKFIRILDTTPILFANWLVRYTRNLPYKEFPTQKGRIAAQVARCDHWQFPSKLVIEGNTIYPSKNDPMAEIANPTTYLIEIDIIQLSSERIEFSMT